MFEGLDTAAAAKVIKASDNRFYVYVLLRPQEQPFYVGKGLGKRLFQHVAEARNTTLRTHKLNVIRAILRTGGEVRYALPHFCTEEAEAHALEGQVDSGYRTPRPEEGASYQSDRWGRGRNRTI
jgi:hypothetical protein